MLVVMRMIVRTVVSRNDPPHDVHCLTRHDYQYIFLLMSSYTSIFLILVDQVFGALSCIPNLSLEVVSLS